MSPQPERSASEASRGARAVGVGPHGIDRSLEIALSGLKRYRLRTALSLFGLAIGVGCVLVTVAIGNGAHRSIQDQIRAAGLNVIEVKAGNYKTKGDETIEVSAPHARLDSILHGLDRILSAEAMTRPGIAGKPS